tara:strand:- start:459 stop:611 length:153 start_codon:yes stop_codon:yes gene_type:complete
VVVLSVPEVLTGIQTTTTTTHLLRVAVVLLVVAEKIREKEDLYRLLVLLI